MARARNIKPGFFSNDILAECDPLARIFFAGLWCQADRAGRLEERQKKLKAEILPYDDGVDVEKFLDQLASRGFILRYSVGVSRFIQILTFEKHQNPHIREGDSTIPAPCEHSASSKKECVPVQPKPEQAGLIPDSPILIPDSPIHPLPAAQIAYTEEFEQAWSSYPTRPGANKKETFKAWNARLKAGVDPQELIAGICRYAHYVAEMKTDPQYVKLPASFLGPGEHYKSDWSPTPRARASPTGYESAKDRSRRETNEALTGKKHHEQRDFIDIN